MKVKYKQEHRSNIGRSSYVIDTPELARVRENQRTISQVKFSLTVFFFLMILIILPANSLCVKEARLTQEISRRFCLPPLSKICDCNCIVIHQVTLAKGQRRDLSVFGSSCHLPTCLPRTVEASYFPFYLVNVKQESCEYQFL